MLYPFLIDQLSHNIYKENRIWLIIFLFMNSNKFWFKRLTIFSILVIVFYKEHLEEKILRFNIYNMLSEKSILVLWQMHKKKLYFIENN